VEKAVIENKHGQGMGAKKASQLSTGKRKETREELLAVRRVCKKLQISAVVAVAVAVGVASWLAERPRWDRIIRSGAAAQTQQLWEEAASCKLQQSAADETKPKCCYVPRNPGARGMDGHVVYVDSAIEIINPTVGQFPRREALPAK